MFRVRFEFDDAVRDAGVVECIVNEETAGQALKKALDATDCVARAERCRQSFSIAVERINHGVVVIGASATPAGNGESEQTVPAAPPMTPAVAGEGTTGSRSSESVA